MERADARVGRAGTGDVGSIAGRLSIMVVDGYDVAGVLDRPVASAVKGGSCSGSNPPIKFSGATDNAFFSLLTRVPVRSLGPCARRLLKTHTMQM
jgi:hypothetical protein